MKTVLVLGANGFIGRYLVGRLLSDGYNVIGYGRTPNDKIRWITGDFGNENRFEDILKKNKIDIIVHLISTTIPAEGSSLVTQDIEMNVLPTIRLLEAMRNAETKEILFLSSGGTVYGESTGAPSKTTDRLQPICSYGLQKKMIEDYLQFYSRLYELQVKIVRLSNPYGVPPSTTRGQGIIPIFIHKLINGENITVYGNTVRDYIHIDDAIEGILRYIKYSGTKTILNLGSGKGSTIKEVVEEIENVAQMEFSSVTCLPIRSCDVEKNVLDISETQEILKWAPLIDLHSGILRTLREIKQNCV